MPYVFANSLSDLVNVILGIVDVVSSEYSIRFSAFGLEVNDMLEFAGLCQQSCPRAQGFWLLHSTDHCSTW